MINEIIDLLTTDFLGSAVLAGVALLVLVIVLLAVLGVPMLIMLGVIFLALFGLVVGGLLPAWIFVLTLVIIGVIFAKKLLIK